MNEQRKYQRIQVHTCDSVIIPELNVGSVEFLDISEGGLSFCYSGRKKWPKETVFLDIVLGSGEPIERLPAKVVFDTETEKPNIRRVGLLFMQLTEAQKNKLKSYIALQNAA